MAMPATRRLILWAMGAAGIALVLPPAVRHTAWRSGAAAPPVPLASLFGDVTSARHIGRAYLEQCRAEADYDSLMADVGDLLTSPASARKFEDMRRQDFTAGRTVMVRGWLLSRTEARLCGLAALA
jgi:hypothetical protein